MEEHVRNYVRTECKYKDQLYLPIITFCNYGGQNIIDFFNNCSFEGGLRGFGELCCKELEPNSADRKDLADALWKYGDYDIDKEEDLALLQIGDWFAIHTVNGLYSLNDTDAKNRVAYILDHCESDREACAKMDEVLPDKVKQVFDRWMSGGSFKELVTESYQDYTNSHFSDTPELREKMLTRQKQLFNELINRGRFNTVQANFVVQQLTRYAVVTSSNPVERFCQICPVMETREHVAKMDYKRMMLGNEAKIKPNSEKKAKKDEKSKDSETRQGLFSKFMSMFKS